ncbi:MAG: acyl-CoA desaturase [Marinobacter sp.]|nr:acyl-CoA desaturase [Marinobacter sp.]
MPEQLGVELDNAHLEQEFKRLKRRIAELGLDQPMPGPVLMQYAVLLALTLGGAWYALFAASGWGVFLGALISSFGSVGLSTSAHSASHIAVTGNRRIDRALTYFGFSFVLGYSVSYWKHKHVENHHANPNNVELDQDIQLRPLFVVTELERERAQGWYRRFHRIQVLVLPFVLGLNLINSQAKSYQFLVSKLAGRDRKRSDVIDALCLVSHFTGWLVLPLLFAPIETVLLVYGLRSLLNGYFGFAVFAPAHLPKEAICLTGDGKSLGHVRRQIYTSVNFRTGWIGALLCQGVEYQIEHHLLPRICHLNYPKISVLVQELCERNDLPYRTLGWGEGLWKSFAVFIEPKRVLTNQQAIIEMTLEAKAAAPFSTQEPLAEPSSYNVALN